MTNLVLDTSTSTPRAKEAEEAVAGSILLGGADAAWLAGHCLQAEDFYESDAKAVFLAAKALIAAEAPVDEATILAELRRSDVLDKIGGEARLCELVNAVPSAANVEWYARKIRSAAALRRLRRALLETWSDIHSGDADFDATAEQAERRLMAALTQRVGAASQDIRALLASTLAAAENGDSRPVVFTHLRALDHVTAGFRGGDLIVVAGRPGSGKTSFALTVALEASTHDRVPVGIVSLEMSAAQVSQAILGQAALVSMYRFRRGEATARDLAALDAAARPLMEANLIHVDECRDTITGIRARARLMRMRHKVELVIVDYVQLVTPEPGAKNREQEVAAISRGLKHLARELDVPVIALAQLNREVEKRENQRPRLSDLRESGALEADADMVLMIYREGYYKPDRMDLRESAEVIVAKNRHGPTGTAALRFEPDVTRFGDANGGGK